MNEKMMILKMLEEGKINSEEASKLLESVGKPTPEPGKPGGSTYTTQQQWTGSPSSYATGSKGPTSSEEYTPNSNGPAAEKTTAPGFDNFANDLGRKFETLAKDWEPKISRFTESVVEKTAYMADKLSKSLQPATPSPVPVQGSAGGSYRAAAVPQGGMEKQFEAVVPAGYNELNITGLNGSVMLKGYNGDKITAKIFYKTKKSGAPIELMQLGNRYFLSYDEDDFAMVTVDAFIPENMFNNIAVHTVNGDLNLSSLEGEYLAVTNSGGNTRLDNIHVANIKVEANNGALDLQNIWGNAAQIENFNGTITCNGIDVANLKMTGFNGGMVLNIPGYYRFTEYLWDLETSNGKLSANLPTSPDLGYHVKAGTSLGSIKMGLTSLNYLQNTTSFIEAKSIAYDTAPKHIKLSLSTSNSSLTVN